jgi:IclR family transcriptional regulator, acetate operon repressor
MTQGRSVVQGVFAVLDALRRVDAIGVTELAGRTGLPKATVHRLLEQLIEESAVERADGRYRLGPTMFRLGHWQPARRLRGAARQPLRELAAAMPGVSLNVALPHRGGTIVAAVVPGEADHFLPLGVGSWCGPHCEPGVLWAAHSPDGEPPEHAEVGAWRRRVADVRARDGITLSPATVDNPELAVVAVPVRDRGGSVAGSVAGVLVGHRRLRELAPLVSRAARLASGNLARV